MSRHPAQEEVNTREMGATGGGCIPLADLVLDLGGGSLSRRDRNPWMLGFGSLRPLRSVMLLIKVWSLIYSV